MDDKKFFRKIMKAGRKFMKKMNRSYSSSDESPSKEKRRHGKCHKKHKEFKEKNREKVLERRAQKMIKAFGGEASDYEGYVDETFDMPMKEAIQKYAKDKNLPVFEERSKIRRGNKLRKLAMFFKKDESEFESIVDENPDAKFKELLKILKEKGTYDFELDEQKI